MSDSLSSERTRRANLDHLLNGIPLVNHLLGLRLPLPRLVRWDPGTLESQGLRNGDPFHMSLLGAIFDAPVLGANDLPQLMESYLGFFDAMPEAAMKPAFEQVLALVDHDDASLVSAISAAMSVRVIELADALASPGFVFAKVNHFHWEYVTCRAIAASGQAYHRRLDPAEMGRVERSRSDELVIRALQRVGAELQAHGAEAGTYDTSRFSLGVSFNNGDGALADDLLVPVPPIMRGAMLGSYGFFKGLLPADSYRFSDGAFPKMLVWRDQIGEFFDAVVKKADAIVFICPDHLRDIRVRNWTGPLECIVVPPTMIAETWPVVLPIVASRLAALFGEHERVFVFIQAGLVSLPLGVLVHLMRSMFPQTSVYCFDMGQAIDVAAYPRAVSQWMRQAELQDTLRHAGQFPVYLEDSPSEC
jgi:hypothetical protein